MAWSSVTHTSISNIPREEWNRFFAREAEGYDYFLTLECSRFTEFNFRYVCVYENDELALIAPLFWADLDLGIGSTGILLRCIQTTRRVYSRFLVERTLFCGSPFGEHGVIGWPAEPDRAPSALRELATAMLRLAKEQNLSVMMFKDFLDTEAPRLALLRKLGFIRAESFPNIVLSLPYKSMDEYLASLSYGTRKDLRRKLRKTEASAAITVEVVNQVEDRLETIYDLYLQTYHAGTVRFEKLTPDYFREVGRRQAKEARFFLFYAGDRLVCFNLCFVHENVLIDKFIGLDYGVARKWNLYFYTWYRNVEWCIQSGIRAYQVGQTDYEAKLQLGGKKVALYFYARHRNIVINRLLQIASPLLAPTSHG